MKVVDVEKMFVEKALKKLDIDRFLAKELEKAGYLGVDIQKTPLGAFLTIYAERPGLVIGRHGVTVKELAEKLEKQFGLERPQISAVSVPVPELSAKIMAMRVASALEQGIHFRRAAFVALNRIMEAGALGAEIIIRGKLRTERARYEKLRAGLLLKAGQVSQEYVDEAVAHAFLKQGKVGVKVRIMLPQAVEVIKTLDRVEVKAAGGIGGEQSGNTEGQGAA
ncbi:MAG: 30S ribosomal protein S3 [Candidatus Nezhaarchaeota archaeon]|nr:30S ribosomal protein S3 [Candidatus Nezhaarchaeota archaeon]